MTERRHNQGDLPVRTIGNCCCDPVEDRSGSRRRLAFARDRRKAWCVQLAESASGNAVIPMALRQRCERIHGVIHADGRREACNAAATGCDRPRV